MFQILLWLITWAWAHPVSFQDSTGIMGYHGTTSSHHQVNYSHRYWFASGVHHFYRPEKKKSVWAVSANFLLKRWNGDSFQGNVYAILGAAQGRLSETSERERAFTALQFDIEDRKFYFLAKYLDLSKDYQQSILRVGMAPYVERFEGMHSWLILEWRKSKYAGEASGITLTPFLRIFYQNLLFEIGQSFDGATQFNYIVHF